jgi:hypothetical protein
VASGAPTGDLAKEREFVAEVLRDYKLHELEQKKRAAGPRDDASAMQARAGIEWEQARLRFEGERDPKRREELQNRWAAMELEVDRLEIILQTEDTRQRIAAAQERVRTALKEQAWYPRNKALRPNGCTTCADSALRFTAAVVAKSEGQLTPDQARAAAMARYPGLVNAAKEIRVNLVHGAQLLKQCGEGAAACARPDLGAVWLEAGAEPSIVAHETMHALTSPGWMRRVPATVNEPMTEYLARDLGYYRQQDGILTSKAYEGGQRLLSEYIEGKPGRKEALVKAYFSGDFSDLEKLDSDIDARMKSWDALMKNTRPGSSVVIDDEALPEPEPGPIFNWGF